MNAQQEVTPTTSDSKSNTTRIIGLCVSLLLLKVAAIWYYYVPPFNVLLKVAMLAIFAWFFLKSLQGLRRRKWLPCFLGSTFAACLLFAPFMNDARAIGLRYRFEFEIRNWSATLGGDNSYILLTGGMGELVYLVKGVVPNAVMFLPIKQIDESCYTENTQISNESYIRYLVCPSGTGILSISTFFLNF